MSKAENTITVDLDTKDAIHQATELKIVALEAENAALRAKLANSVAAVAGTLCEYKPPRYEYKAMFLLGSAALPAHISTEQPDDWEVFAVPSERCVVYRRPIEESTEPS